jgi:GxxExxY protein
MDYAPIPAEDEELAHKVIGAAIEVHRVLGPGFIESIYGRALCHELFLRGIPFECEKRVEVPFKDIKISGQRLDIIVGGRVVIELKSIDQFAPIHAAKLISYLKALDLRLGLLINFKVMVLKDGIKRVVR